MTKQPDLVVFTTPPYQPIASRAHEILQRAHDALAFLEIEAMDKHYDEADSIDADSELESSISDEDYDEWRERMNARIVHNSRMENLWRDLHNIVRKLESGLGAVEDYR